MVQQRRKPGTRPRGDRGAISVRVPVDQRSIYEELAAELGIPLSSWVAKQLAEAQGLEIPDYIQEEIRKATLRRQFESGQEELPLARSA